MIITVVHQKGGVGKSTLSLNLAYALQEYVQTAILDIDPQGTLKTVRHLHPSLAMYDGIKTFQTKPLSDFPALLIDTPPYNTEHYAQLFKSSDFILIPTKPGYADILAIRATILITQEAQKANKNLRAAIVINMVKPSTSLTEEARNTLKQFKMPVLTAQVNDRVSYVRSLAMDGGITATQDKLAIEEIQVLAQEILQMMKK